MRRYLFKRKFKKLESKVSTHPEFVKKIKSMNLIFDATEESSRASINQFKSELEKNGCQVHVLAFINQKLKEEKAFAFPVYDKSAVNWYGIPTSEEIELFATKNTDATLLANIDGFPHMDYVARACDSTIKLGLNTVHGHYQDIFISIKDPSLKEFLNSSKTILKELQLLD